MQIAVIGAGYVGLITALAFAKMGNNVICVDKDTEKVDKLNQGIVSLYEEDVEDLLVECRSAKKILFTADLQQAVKKSFIIFIAVGTPSLDDGSVDMTQIAEVSQQISNSINDYKIIVIKSTVPVGTQKTVKDILLKNGVSEEHFDLVSNPEFLREGKALFDFFHQDRIVIGNNSQKARITMENLYKPFKATMIFTTPETAELIKYASNAFLATKISFINEIANLCNEVGVDIATISYALGLDKRISPQFLRAGIGYGGSCFPKDTKALLKIGEKHGQELKIIKSTVEVNENQRILPVQILQKHYPTLKNQVISILGLTFKADTDDFREAPSCYIIEELLKRGAIIKCYDPKVSDRIKEIFPDLLYCANPYKTLEDSICAIICTDWEEFSQLQLPLMKKKMKHPMIIDGRNIFSLEDVKKNGIQYYSIGRGWFIN